MAGEYEKFEVGITAIIVKDGKYFPLKLTRHVYQHIPAGDKIEPVIGRMFCYVVPGKNDHLPQVFFHSVSVFMVHEVVIKPLL